MSKKMYQVRAMLSHSMASGFWMEEEEIPYDELIAYLEKLEQERDRWKAAVEEVRKSVEGEAAPFEPVSPSEYFNGFARQLLTRMEES